MIIIEGKREMKGDVYRRKPILAFDQSFRITGYAAIDEYGNIVDIGIFKTTPSLSDQERMEEIFNQSLELMKKYADHRIVIEDIQMQHSVSTFKKLAYAQSAIMFAAEQLERPVELMSASSWRSHLSKKYGISFGRNRKAQKETALKLVKEVIDVEQEHGSLLNVSNITQDMADAACIGLAARDELIS